MQIKISRPQNWILKSKKEINLYMSGVGSGKTFLASLISAYYANKFPNVRGFIGANTYEQLNTSTLIRVRENWRNIFQLKEGEDFVVGIKPPKEFNTQNHNFDSYDSIISWRNGAVMYKASLDNYKVHEGKEIAWAILDETKDTKEEAVKEVILSRIRQLGIYIQDGVVNNEGGDPFNPIYIFTTPAKVDWINEWFKFDIYEEEILSTIYDKESFFKKEYEDKRVCISSTYHNSKNLPKNYIQRILTNNTEENAKRLIYGNPFVKTGGEFYNEFDRTKHVEKVDYLPELPIHISFDQNVVPYITARLWQLRIGEKKELRNFDEFCLSDPNNKTEALCKRIIAKYGDQLHGLFFYGDASGKRRDTRGLETDYTIIERVFRKYLNNYSNRVKYKNPPVVKRREFVNNLFAGVYPWITIKLDKNCKFGIKDYEFVKVDENGKKFKEREKDSRTGVTYEKYGHCSDADDYFFCAILEDLFIKEFGK